MRRTRTLLLVLLASSGCGSAPLKSEIGIGKVNDPMYGLPKYADFREDVPVDRTAAYRDWSMAADPKRRPGYFKADAGVDAAIERHPSWRSDFPVERSPARSRFFLAGMAAGFAARLGYGVLRSGVDGGLKSGEFGSALALGLLTGSAAWGYSFRIPASQVSPRLAQERIPTVEESAVYRDWRRTKP